MAVFSANTPTALVASPHALYTSAMTANESEALQHIARSARHLLHVSGGPPTASTSAVPTLLAIVLEWRLPDPRPITSLPAACGTHPSTSAQLSKIFLRTWLRTCHSFERDVLSHAEKIRLAYCDRYAARLQEWSELLLHQYQQQHTAFQPVKDSRNIPDINLFNQALPLLKQAFSHDQYPSRVEKERLANITGLEYKQVSVWFQNHRSRTKKGGRELKKGNIFHHIEGDFSTISRCRKGQSSVTLAYGSQDLSSSSRSERPAVCRVHSLNTLAKLASQRPDHAYPAPYPPICQYDPFPIHERVIPFSIPWLRRPLPSQAGALAHTADGAIDEIVALLENLTLDGVASSSPTLAGRAGFCGYVEVQTAPLPALIRASGAATSLSSPNLQTVEPPIRLAGGGRSARHTKIRRSGRSATIIHRSRMASVPVRELNHPYLPSQMQSLRSSRSASVGSVATVYSSSSESDSSADTPLSTPPDSLLELPDTKQSGWL